MDAGLQQKGRQNENRQEEKHEGRIKIIKERSEMNRTPFSYCALSIPACRQNFSSI
jgi:hypothetical protein